MALLPKTVLPFFMVKSEPGSRSGTSPIAPSIYLFHFPGGLTAASMIVEPINVPCCRINSRASSGAWISANICSPKLTSSVPLWIKSCRNRKINNIGHRPIQQNPIKSPKQQSIINRRLKIFVTEVVLLLNMKQRDVGLNRTGSTALTTGVNILKDPV